MREASPLRSWLVLAALIAASGDALAAGDPERGARAMTPCLRCHALEEGRHMTGPSLHEIFGRNSATVAGFDRYSDALKGAGLVWNENNLDRYLANPAALVPGNRMTAATPDAQVRADIVAYLAARKDGALAEIPEPSPRQLDLRSLGPASRVTALSLCRDTWRVTLENGATLPFWERNLEFKTDSSVYGPEPGQPTLAPRGREGDRAMVIFADPAEIGAMLQRRCETAEP
jgi:cytochrome c